MAFRNLKRAMPLAAALALAAVAGGTARAAVEHTQLVSVGMDGKPGNRASAVDVVSADGRYVMFDSDASDLVPHDSNRSPDVFIRDLLLGTTQRVNLTTAGAQIDDGTGADMTPDARWVLFTSTDTGIVSRPDANRHGDDLFLKDTASGRTVRVGVTPDGSQVRCGFGDTDYPRAFVTSDATKVIFGATRGHRSCALFRTDTYLRDRVHHRTVRLAPRLGPSVPLGITNGGRFVVLAADIGPRGAYHRLYLLDRRHGLTDLTLLLPPHRHRFWDRVYLSRNAAAIAIGVGDRTFVYHRSTGSMDLAASANLVVPRGISMDGRFMAVIDRDPGLLGPSDRGGVFRLDTATQDMARADVLDTGPFPEDVWLYHAAMSADGSTIAFSSAPLDDSFRTQAWVRTGLPAGS